ncbi:MAG: tRNA (adenosine(37)-N6)-threonylcarbamoyltransferase complex ATPase subunit type 1 TsaE [Pseudobdellovibrionaceae bacterium]
MTWNLLFKKDISTLDLLHEALEECLPFFKKRQVILLNGTLGAGKTQSVRILAELMGYDVENIASPTFAIHHSYGPEFQHVDLYRLENEDELESSGFWDLFSSPSGLIAVEWPERVNEEHWPQSWNYMVLQINKKDDSREMLAFSFG